MTAPNLAIEFDSSTYILILFTQALDLEDNNAPYYQLAPSIPLFLGLEIATNPTNKRNFQSSQHGREEGGRPGSWHALGRQVHRFERLGKQVLDAVY
jgi:hypothetical protein